MLGVLRRGNLFGCKSPLISEQATRPFGRAIDASEHRDKCNGLLRMAESRALAREQNIGPQHKLKATAVAKALHRRDDRNGQPLETIEPVHVALEDGIDFV